MSVIVVNGIVMALYLALTILVAPVSSGPIQFRISESLNHLVVFNRKLLWGVLGGVIVYNAFFGFGIMDVVFGGGQTLLSLGLTALLQNKVKNVKMRFSIEHDLLYHQHGIDCLYASSDRWPSILDNLWYTCIKRVHHHGCFSTTDVLFRSFA